MGSGKVREVSLQEFPKREPRDVVRQPCPHAPQCIAEVPRLGLVDAPQAQVAMPFNEPPNSPARLPNRTTSRRPGPLCISACRPSLQCIRELWPVVQRRRRRRSGDNAPGLALQQQSIAANLASEHRETRSAIVVRLRIEAHAVRSEVDTQLGINDASIIPRVGTAKLVGLLR